MSPSDRAKRLRADVELVAQCAAYYHRRLAHMITAINAGDAPGTPDQCLRLCVEAVDTLLSSQGQLCRILKTIADDDAAGAGPGARRLAA